MFEKHTWEDNELITAPKLNRIENELEKLSVSGTLRNVVGFDVNGNQASITLGWSQLSNLNNPPNFNTGVLSATTFNPDGSATFYFHELNDGVNDNAKEGAIPVYGLNGVLKVATGVNDLDAINKSQLESYVTNAINQAELGGDDSEIDLSAYALKSDLTGLASKGYVTSEISSLSTTIDNNLTSYEKITDNTAKLNLKADKTTVDELTQRLDDLTQLQGLKIANYSVTANSGRWTLDYSELGLTTLIGVYPIGVSGDDSSNSGTIAILTSKNLTTATGQAKTVIGAGLLAAVELTNADGRKIEVLVIGK